MDAIEKYDPEKNCKFKTYAEFRIKGAILDQLRSLDWVPRSVRQKGRKLERAYGEVEQRLGRSANEDEVADSLGLELDKFHTLINQVRGISLVNLEEIRGTNSDGDRAGTFADIIEDVHSENPFASLKLMETKHVISDTIGSLPEKERLVISLYYYEDLNMKEIGSILGITESRVCQIHTKAVHAPALEAEGHGSTVSGLRRRRALLLVADEQDGDVVEAAARLAASTSPPLPRRDPRSSPTRSAISSSATWVVRPSEQSTKTIARLRRHLGQIGLRPRAHAERAGQHVAMRMLAGVRLADLLATEQLGDDRVVVGQSAKPPVAEQVGAAVAHVGESQSLAAEEHARRRSCPCPTARACAWAAVKISRLAQATACRSLSARLTDAP